MLVELIDRFENSPPSGVGPRAGDGLVAPWYRFDLSPAEVKVILDTLRQCGQTVGRMADAIEKRNCPD